MIAGNSICFLIGLGKLSLKGRLSQQIHRSDPRLKSSQLKDVLFKRIKIALERMTGGIATQGIDVIPSNTGPLSQMLIENPKPSN